jgi:hypothetical protein
MKSLKRTILLVMVLVMAVVPVSIAMTVYDPINAALNELRNSIMTTEWAKEIAVAIEHLNELRTQTLELFRFNSGFDEILNSIIGDPLGQLFKQGKTSLRDAFMDTGLGTPQIEMFDGRGGPQDIRRALEEISGEIPQGNLRPYIPFEEMMVVDAFDVARQIREGGTETRDAAELIADQAKTASPKGAARLNAQGISQLMVVEQQSQEAMAKLIELNATQVEQVTRIAKEAERERIQYLKDANDFLDGHFSSLS